MLYTHIAALAATVLAVSGCGESSKTTSSTTVATTESAKPLTRGELIAKADAICKGVNTQRASITIRSNQDYVTKLPPLAAHEQNAAAELAKLTPPSSMESDWKQIVADAQTLAADTVKVSEYAKANNIKAAQTLASAANRTQEKMLVVGVRNGFKDCGQNPS